MPSCWYKAIIQTLTFCSMHAIRTHKSLAKLASCSLKHAIYGFMCFFVFLQEHGKVERLRFLDILRAHFAIPSEAARPPRPIKRPLTPPSSEDMSEGDEDVPTHRQASQSALHLRGAPPGGRMLRSAMHAGYAVRAVVHEDPVLVSSPKVGPGPHADEFVAFSGTVMVPVRPLEQHHARSSAAQAAEPSSAREFFCLPTPPPFPVEVRRAAPTTNGDAWPLIKISHVVIFLNRSKFLCRMRSLCSLWTTCTRCRKQTSWLMISPAGW